MAKGISFSWFVVGLASLLLCACEKPPIRIGFSGTLTGPYADLGVHGRNGVQLALEEINQKGGVAGRRLELVIRDDKGSSDGAIQADRELIQAKVAAIIGHMTSAQSVAALPLIQQAEMVLLSPTTSTPELSGIKDFFFRVQPATDKVAMALARHAVLEKGFLHLGTVRDLRNKAFSEPFHHFFMKEFQALCGTLHLEKTISPAETPDWEGLARELSQIKPQALLVILSARDAAALAQTLHARNLSLPLLSSNWAMTEDLLTAGGKTVETVIFAAHTFRENPSPQYQMFLQRYFDRFGHLPSFAAEYAYDAMHILALALEKTRGKREGLPQALTHTQDYPGLHWPISLDAFGDTLSPIYILEVQEGRFESIRQILLEPAP